MSDSLACGCSEAGPCSQHWPQYVAAATPAPAEALRAIDVDEAVQGLLWHGVTIESPEWATQMAIALNRALAAAGTDTGKDRNNG